MHVNENIQYNIETITMESNKLRVGGWLFAELPIVSLELVVPKALVEVHGFASYGINSPDVAVHYGPKAHAARFDDRFDIDLHHDPVLSSVIRVTFEGGATREISLAHRLTLVERAPPQSNVSLGIAITTYNRRETLEHTLDRVMRHTLHPYHLVVADDGSSDETIAALEARRVSYITGVNRGIAWNKNRALYYVNNVRCCDISILLEDDTYPTVDGWENEWMEGARRWGHINMAGHWFSEKFIGGAGTPEDPIRSTVSSGQCVSFSREAVEFGGFFDPRFGRYGFEHVEHTERMLKAGYGGTLNEAGEPTFFMLSGGVFVGHMLDFHYMQDVAKNAPIYDVVRHEDSPRLPWRNLEQMQIFRDEVREAIARDRTDDSAA